MYDEIHVLVAISKRSCRLMVGRGQELSTGYCFLLVS